MHRIEGFVSLQQETPGILVEGKLLQLDRLLDAQQLGGNITKPVFEHLGMFGMFGHELSFLQVEEGGTLAIAVFDLKTEKAGQVEDEEKRKVGKDAAFG